MGYNENCTNNERTLYLDSRLYLFISCYMNIKASTIVSSIYVHKNIQKAVVLAKFFKTGKGEYGEGDRFLGIAVPDIRKIAKIYYKNILLKEIQKIIISPYHEVRLCALILLVNQYTTTKSVELKTDIYKFYLSHTKYINNWNLVDLTAPHIVGMYLLHYNHNPMKVLTALAQSASLWERRIGMLATFSFIRTGKHKEAFAMAKMLLHDEHDLMHKAVGWMLREVGKRVRKEELCAFLDTHAEQMPRTMLHYAIERFPEKERRYYMKTSRL